MIPSAAEAANPEMIWDARSESKLCVLDPQTFAPANIGREIKKTGLFPIARINGTQNIFPAPRSSMLKHVK
jgi:hypothetical protein